MILRFEEISNNAWPALQTLQYDGWILRFANGVTKRSNSVNPLYPSTLDIDQKIDYCENIFRQKQIPPTFKITPDSEPDDLDKVLEKRGYFIHCHVSFQVMELSADAISPEENVQMAYSPDERWMDDFIRMNGFEQTRKSTYIRIMEQIITPKCLVSIKEKNKTIGVGLGVLEDRFLGLFDLVVDPEFRNRGLGARLVNSLLNWGLSQEADTAYLQVLTDNLPAIRLYHKLGFKERYLYWYRLKTN